MQAIGQMTGGVAHDFNNMLASIQGYTELAKDTVGKENTGKIVSYLEEVLRSSRRASNLVQKMLAFSRGNAKQLELQSLSAIVDEALEILKSTLPSSIIISTEFEKDLPQVMADTVRLEQVMTNLSKDFLSAFFFNLLFL